VLTKVKVVTLLNVNIKTVNVQTAARKHRSARFVFAHPEKNPLKMDTHAKT
jgi:hypothetical protein